MKNHLVIALVLLSGIATAHDAPTSFPEGSSKLTAEALTLAVENKKFTAQPADGPSWQLDYSKGGLFSVNVGSFSDAGTWIAKGSSICTEGKKLKYLCNELRIKDGTLFMKRKGGEVMRLSPN